MWDATTGQESHRLPAPARTAAVAVSADGKRLAVGRNADGGGAITVYDTDGFQPTATVALTNAAPSALAFLADGRLGGLTQSTYPSNSKFCLAVWDAGTGKELARHDLDIDGF